MAEEFHSAAEHENHRQSDDGVGEVESPHENLGRPLRIEDFFGTCDNKTKSNNKRYDSDTILDQRKYSHTAKEKP